MKGLFVIILALGLSACGPDLEEDCETICEGLRECSPDFTGTVSACTDECLDDAEDDDECGDAVHAFAECVDGGGCDHYDCAGEGEDVDDECN